MQGEFCTYDKQQVVISKTNVYFGQEGKFNLDANNAGQLVLVTPDMQVQNFVQF